MTLKTFSLPALLAAAALIAGCGSSDSGTSSSSYGSVKVTPPPATKAHTATVRTANGPLGTYLVDQKGDALYLFEKDKPGSGHSTCSSSCAQLWPPVVTSGRPQAERGALAGQLSTISRGDGQKQVAYHGWPLYRYAPDMPGTTKGQDLNTFGATWYVLAPSGEKIGD
jgi:predicted lipoprotein with Yx(FWY)xxD motif